MSIMGNMVGGAAPLKTLIIEDENGTEMVGVVTGSEVVFTANSAKDIREGTVAATEEGIITGSKRIPSYETTRSSRLIMPGSAFSIPLSDYNKYDYTQFQCIIAKRNTSLQDSVAVDKVGISDNIYFVNSTESLAQITKNADTKSIDLNITNNTEDIYYIHFFTFKEE